MYPEPDVTGAPAEWWQWFALLGPVAAPLIIAAATLTAAGVAASIALRTLRQRDLADRRAEWWRRTQWAFDAIESGVSSRRQLGLGVMEVLAESELPSTEEVRIVARTWHSWLRAAEHNLDAQIIIENNGSSDAESEGQDEDDHSPEGGTEGRGEAPCRPHDEG